mmetsp:Transcript_13817/g.16690  ORF Transcript_13817/g.16690 Transcript_13817/m.16690 type:complete len:898 (-) Transcript_13817:346-3039(-)
MRVNLVDMLVFILKEKKRKARTGQQPLACVPPIGPQANGELYESRFRCIDPHGIKTDGDPVRLGDEILLVDSEGHVWNTSTAGVVGYLTVRLRGERGELRVRFTRDLSSVNYKGVCYAEPDAENGWTTDSRPDTPPLSTVNTTDHLDVAQRQSSPRALSRPRSSNRIRTSPRSSFVTEQPCVRYNDALWLVSCPQHDETHPGAARNMRKEHVLTNFKRDTSSTLGGYLTVDPRGFALQFVIARTPPAIDVLQIADQSHYGLPWDMPIAFTCQPGKCSLRILFSTGATSEIFDINEKLFSTHHDVPHMHHSPLKIESRHSGIHNVKFWLKLNSASCQSSMGSVLIQVAAVQSPALSTDTIKSQKQQSDPLSQFTARLAVVASALVALESTAARAVIIAAAPADAILTWSSSLLVKSDETSPVVGSILIAALALLTAAAPAFIGWIACVFIWIAAIVLAIQLPSSSLPKKEITLKSKQIQRAELLLTSVRPALRGEIALLEWSPDSGLEARSTSDSRMSPPPTADAQKSVSFEIKQQPRSSDDFGRESSIDRGSLMAGISAPASMAYPSKKKDVGKTEVVQAEEKVWLAELRDVVKSDAFAPRWLEDGELLRFVRARKSIEERVELYREAMAWRKNHSLNSTTDNVYGASVRADPKLGSFGCLEQEWCLKSQEPPAWWAFISSNVPFELYGSDRTGLPITYLGLGRMDLAGVVREVGIDRLEQKIVMQNDMFLDLARQRRILAGDESVEKSTSSEIQNFRALHGGIFIIDCDGMARRHLTEIRIFKRVSAALKILHPERQRKTFVVRAPRVFAVIWRLIKPMLDARIISKINILGANDSLKPLIDELGLDNVPSNLGGNVQLANPPTNSLIAQGAFDAFQKSLKKAESSSTAATPASFE